MVSVFMKAHSSLTWKINFNGWLKLKYFRYQNFVKYHHWKILLVGIGVLGLCWLGFKSMEFEKDLLNLWIYNSSRLSDETSYTTRTSGNQLDSGSIETILQVSLDNLLTTEYLLEHVQLMRQIINVSVRDGHRTYSFGHFCHRLTFPKMQYLPLDLRETVKYFEPCQIISPLNCFWEGSKLLDKDPRPFPTAYDVEAFKAMKIDWKTFNLSSEFLHTFKSHWKYDFFATLFQEAGISSGYVGKPCIDVTDPFCPNKNQKNVDFEAILDQGCYQIAENLYKYPKSVFVGKNNRGLQSLLVIRSAGDILQSMHVKEQEWTESKIQDITNLWLNELRKTVIKFNTQRPYLSSMRFRNKRFQSQRVGKSSFYVFTNNSLNSALSQASNDETLLAKYFISGGVVMLFMIVIFVTSNNLVRSHCWLAITSVILIAVAIVSGLGLAAVAGFTFSALTTQVIPFLMIGLGLDEILILTKRYTKSMDHYQLKTNVVHPVAQALFDCATILTVSFAIKMLVICSAILIPVPLMRSFCVQIFFITLLQTGINVFLYPCLLNLDFARRASNRIDLLCCLLKRQSSSQDPESQSQSQHIPQQYDSVPKESDILRSRVIFSTEFTTSPNTLIPNNVHQYCEINPIDISRNNQSPSPKSFSRSASKNSSFEEKSTRSKKNRCCWKFRYRISKTFLQIIVLVPVQITVILVTILIIVMGLYSAINIDCGLILESIFLRVSNEHNYVKYESITFRMQTFEIITKEMDYINYQEYLLQVHNEINEISQVELFGNGKFWFSSLVIWLQKIQNDFDLDVKYQFILPNGTWMKNASKNGLLAMTMMVQDGELINYKKLETSRLLQAQQVDKDKFYLYLNVWRSVSIDFDSLPCDLFPKMVFLNMDNFVPNDFRDQPVVIRMSAKNFDPLKFVSCKYFYKGQSQKEDLAFVKKVRTITEKFTNHGVPTIPMGNIFSLSEQYVKLRHQLMIMCIVLVAGMFIVSLLAVNHFFASILATLLLSSSLISPILFMNFYQIPLNATSGVMALWSGGLGFRFSLFLIVSYVEQSELHPANKTQILPDLTLNRCSKLDVNKEKQMQLKLAFADVQCGKATISSLLGMAFILMTDINFLWKHFLLLPSIGLIHSMMNYYCLAPIICFYFINKSESTIYKPPVHKSHSNTLFHRPVNKSSRARRSHIPRNISKFDINDDSSIHGKLSIIPEESSSVLSSIKSTRSHENQNIAPDSSPHSSQSQDRNSHFMEQNVESSVVIHYTLEGQLISHNADVNTQPELAVKTFFKYRQPMGGDQ